MSVIHCDQPGIRPCPIRIRNIRYTRSVNDRVINCDMKCDLIGAVITVLPVETSTKSGS